MYEKRVALPRPPHMRERGPIGAAVEALGEGITPALAE
jgi:hypothetical protein